MKTPALIRGSIDRIRWIRQGGRNLSAIRRACVAAWLLAALCGAIPAQQRKPLDSLLGKLHDQSLHDTVRASLLSQVALEFKMTDPDRGLEYAVSGLAIAKSASYTKGEADCLYSIGVLYGQKADFPKALDHYFRALALYEKNQYARGINYTLGNIGIVYSRQSDVDKALDYYRRSLIGFQKTGDRDGIAAQYLNLGNLCNRKTDYAKALEYYDRALEIRRAQRNKTATAVLLGNIANIHSTQARYRRALDFYFRALAITEELGLRYSEGQVLANIGYTYMKMVMDSTLDAEHGRSVDRRTTLLKSIEYTRKAMEIAGEVKDQYGLMNRYHNLSEAYAELKDFRRAHEFLLVTQVLRDSIFTREKQQSIADLEARQQDMIREKELQIITEREKNFKYMGAGGAIIAALGGVLLFLRIRHQRRTSELRAEAAEAEARALQADNERKELELRKAQELETAYQHLRRTQAQLIQHEKMATLGQLAAGIAHELKNPLNFVNNFAELSRELVGELASELGKNPDLADRLAVLAENNERIIEHGGRADRIVRGMMEHARKAPGERQATDLNALVDEAVDLFSNQTRARYPELVLNVKTTYDPTLPNVEVVQRDIHRVLLNVLGNAAEAMWERYEDAGGEAKLRVRTLRSGQDLEIRIADNGTGIPESVRERIFQPFVTTKTGGEGAGLGLWISHDIIVEGHGGRILVQSSTGEGSEFTIVLPMQGEREP